MGRLNTASVCSWSGSDYHRETGPCITPSGADTGAADRRHFIVEMQMIVLAEPLTGLPLFCRSFTDTHTELELKVIVNVGFFQ